MTDQQLEDTDDIGEREDSATPRMPDLRDYLQADVGFYPGGWVSRVDLYGGRLQVIRQWTPQAWDGSTPELLDEPPPDEEVPAKT